MAAGKRNKAQTNLFDPIWGDYFAGEQEQQRWVPVKERLPENIGLYLVIENHWLDGSPGIKIAKWNTVDWFTADRKSSEITPRVTHWMPLLEPPKYYIKESLRKEMEK